MFTGYYSKSDCSFDDHIECYLQIEIYRLHVRAWKPSIVHLRVHSLYFHRYLAYSLPWYLFWCLAWHKNSIWHYYANNACTTLLTHIRTDQIFSLMRRILSHCGGLHWIILYFSCSIINTWQLWNRTTGTNFLCKSRHLRLLFII